MKTILMVAGGKFQVPLAKKIKEMGHTLVCTNLYEDSPAFAYADFSYVVNVLDKEKNLQVARKHNVDAVVSDQSDISMETLAYVAEHMGLPTNGMDIALLCSDKLRMRAHCKAHGFPVPDFVSCKNVEEATAFLKGREKIVIKPQNSQASRGVFFISSEKELREKFPESQKYSHGEGLVVAEDFMDGGSSDGREFTVDGLFLNGKHHTLCISKKRHYEYNTSIAHELLFSLEDDTYDYAGLMGQNNKLMESTGAKIGMSHNEYKLHNGQFHLIEMSNRGGGNGISSMIVPIISGVDNHKLYIRQSLGEQVETLEICEEKKHAFVIMKFFDHRQFSDKDRFVIQAIEGLAELQAHPNILDVCINHSVGEIMQRAENGTNRPGYFIAYADSLEELQEIQSFVFDTIKIRG